MSVTATVGANLAGFVESLEFDRTPFAIDMNGRPFIPVGHGGIVLGVELGDSVFGHEGDHVAPGATLVHPDQAARHALTAFACIGNEVIVRTGAAAGASGRVLGKRGEAGRVIAVFDQEVLCALAPGDSTMVRSRGQGSVLPPELANAGAIVVNIDMRLLEVLGIDFGSRLTVPVRAVVPSKLVGNGLGRPVQMWDVDLSVTAETAGRWGMPELLLGDLVCVRDLDVRHNIGYRAGWSTIGVIVHGASRLPGHGPGLTPILCAPSNVIDLDIDDVNHRGLTADRLGFNHG